MNPSIRALPSTCTAFSQSLSVNSFRWRIWGERAGNTNSHFRMDHVTRNALAARKNEAQGLGNQVPRIVQKKATQPGDIGRTFQISGWVLHANILLDTEKQQQQQQQ